MAIISAFADEISADPKVQIDTLLANGVDHVDLRGAWDTNVMKLSDAQCKELKRMFADRGVTVACIGSPIGKVPIDGDLDAHFDEFKHSCDLAESFGCGPIRMFSYYPPESGGSILDHRERVMERLQQMIDYVQSRPILLVLENESKLYGSMPEQMQDLMETLANDKLTMAFDPANFVNDGAMPVFETCWEPLKQYVGYFHIKDKVSGSTGPCVPAGEGDGDMEKILGSAAAMGYNGILTLEPHLSAAGQFKGDTGPQLFGKAVAALKGICDRVGLKY
ncbi:MAG: sugar phosphate isomerase/epimerase [Phycisphaerae bacterium]|nr:sugar phosphate isomerase/epimerase [Phycisphaerae bacterium]